jgi:hypothetical protein
VIPQGRLVGPIATRRAALEQCVDLVRLEPVALPQISGTIHKFHGICNRNNGHASVASGAGCEPVIAS